MSDQTAIEWTDATWNPTTGCTKVSPGCDHCYAEGLVNRFAGKNKAFPNRFDVVTIRDDKTLMLPLSRKWAAPRRIFVNSLSDLFHDDVPTITVARVFAVMALAQHHTFQLLTKRHGRMRSQLSSEAFIGLVYDLADSAAAEDGSGPMERIWPLPNVWLGVSVENQQWADIRIPALLDTPAAVRFLSCEPLLGPVDLRQSFKRWTPPLSAFGDSPVIPARKLLHWVITGGESGRGARPAHPDWFRAIRDQCGAARVAYLHKQNGEWASFDGPLPYRTQWGYLRTDGSWGAPPPSQPPGTNVARVGKKLAGRELDGRTWDEYPATVTA